MEQFTRKKGKMSRRATPRSKYRRHRHGISRRVAEIAAVVGGSGTRAHLAGVETLPDLPCPPPPPLALAGGSGDAPVSGPPDTLPAMTQCGQSSRRAAVSAWLCHAPLILGGGGGGRKCWWLIDHVGSLVGSGFLRCASRRSIEVWEWRRRRTLEEHTECID